MKKKNWKTILAPVLALLALGVATVPDLLRDWQNGQGAVVATSSPARVESRQTDNRALLQLIEQKRSGEMVMGQGVVEKVLKDDDKGSRHQRFILDVGAGKTVLVAHNIDLAPRLPNLKAGEQVRFYAQYESNHRDGVLHWTHHDPAGRHEDGWLEYQGKRYQ